MSDDKLLNIVFSELQIWENAIMDGKEKKIKQKILEKASDPNERDELKNKIANHGYHIKPPHEAQIPKDDGTMRTVYANEAEDRILLTVINNVFFKYFSDMIHPTCKSYQIGIGCGKIVKQITKTIENQSMQSEYIGYKIDLSKYFDSVPIQYIDGIFDEVETKIGPSSILDLLREYYHSDVLLDMQKKEIHKYTSLRQGCAVAAFLADAVLYDIDAEMQNYNITYCRYSDDILILGENADEAYRKISKMLNEKSLTLNPKKVEHLTRNTWFTFLGFSIRNISISLSKKRIKNLQKVIESKTIRCKACDSSTKAKHKIYQYLYDTSLTPYSYAEGILPVINNTHDINILDTFIADCCRACDTKKTKIGGIGYNKSGKEGVLTRGTGRHVSKNREKHADIDYQTISFMQTLFNSNKDVYAAYVTNIVSS